MLEGISAMSEAAPARDRDTEPVGHRARSSNDTDTVGAQAKTSTAAVFALIFGLIGFLAALTGLLAPVAVVLGLIGLILGIVGIRAAKRPLTTGKGVAIGGLVLSVLALLLGIAAIIGAASVVSSNPQILDQISNLVTSARSRVGA